MKIILLLLLVAQAGGQTALHPEKKAEKVYFSKFSVHCFHDGVEIPCEKKAAPLMDITKPCNESVGCPPDVIINAGNCAVSSKGQSVHSQIPEDKLGAPTLPVGTIGMWLDTDGYYKIMHSGKPAIKLDDLLDAYEHIIPEDKLGEWIETHCRIEQIDTGLTNGLHTENSGMRIRCDKVKP